MGALSTALTATALRLLTNYGQAISVVRDNITSYTVSTGAVVDASDTSYSGYGHPGNYEASMIDGVLIQQNDIRLVFSSTTEPLVSDIFTVDSVAYTALAIQKYKAQGDKIAYIVQLRQ